MKRDDCTSRRDCPCGFCMKVREQARRDALALEFVAAFEWYSTGWQTMRSSVRHYQQSTEKGDAMKRCYMYLRTSGDDGRDKAGLPVQRESCVIFAQRSSLEIAAEFTDDGVTGKLPMHARPKGKVLIAALLADGVKTVLTYDAKRIGRTQPAFWSFIGLCRDNGITVLDASGTDLGGSVMGGVNGMLAEMDRDATVSRLAAGKKQWRGQRRVDGRWPYGEHPSHEYDAERTVVARIRQMQAEGISSYAIAKTLNGEGTRTRYGCEFKVQTVQNILERTRAPLPS
jgi:DNA invertase Pin-like site-specific DNA recombinase